MTSSEHELILVRRWGAVAHVILNRPQAFNSLSLELATQLEAALRSLSPEVDAIIVRGAGGNFCAGADLKFIRESRVRPELMRELVDQVGAAFNLIERLPIPVVAAIEGYCLAGGFELMQACDFAVAAEDAVIGDAHVQFSQLPGGGGSQRLPRRIGRQAALGLLLTGDRFSGAEAAARGLIHRAYPSDRFERGVAELGALLSERGRGALEPIKRLVIECEELPLDEALARERDAFVEHVTGPVGGAGLDRFLERKQAAGQRR